MAVGLAVVAAGLGGLSVALAAQSTSIGQSTIREPTRGRLLDRQERVMATSVASNRSGPSPRLYPYGEAAYPVTGAAVPGASLRGLEAHLDGVLEPDSVADEGTDDALAALRGGDVVLTIDAELQQMAYDKLEGRRGAAVVLDVQTGEVLAMVSSPSWQPNVWQRRPDGSWANRIDIEAWGRAGFDLVGRPMHNRAVDEIFPPGSTFKLVTAASALQHRVSVNSRTSCSDRHPITGLRCHTHLHKEPSITWALAESCNHYFGSCGLLLGSRLRHTANAFGFNEGFDLTRGVPGISWTTASSRAFEKPLSGGGRSVHSSVWFSGNPALVAQGAIGQNEVEATPLQMAVVAAVIANGGHAVDPHLVREIRPSSARLASRTSPLSRIRIVGTTGERLLARKHARCIRKGMIEVFTEGTAAGSVAIEGSLPTSYSSSGHRVTVAGKTGTADVEGKEPHSWFVGFAPVDEPRVAVAVLVENGGPGATVAAPIGVRVLADAAITIR